MLILSQLIPTPLCVFRIVTSWEVKSIGHPVVLPLKVCEELLQVMDESNSTLPASMRCMRSYEVSVQNMSSYPELQRRPLLT
ncbi:hypothetical protein GOODEAATRI_028417 [Goodea atripinnis]|uniref:Uncharacterized protein n=1 Tax=Goodea atripinnis TaxID=208336 RepID=A0ABV0NNX7_9TELE